jgi:hypothetical protein
MDALRVLTEDQMLIDELLNEARSAAEPREKRLLFNDGLVLLNDHLSCAEKIVYAQLIHAPKGPDFLLTEQIEIHRKLRKLGSRIARIAAQREFSSQLEKFSQRVRHLFEREENLVFPSLWRSLTDLQLLQLGMEIQRAREPRPHPLTVGDLNDDVA